MTVYMNKLFQQEALIDSVRVNSAEFHDFSVFPWCRKDCTSSCFG